VSDVFSGIAGGEHHHGDADDAEGKHGKIEHAIQTPGQKRPETERDDPEVVKWRMGHAQPVRDLRHDVRFFFWHSA
jgi:hypothetical protein